MENKTTVEIIMEASIIDTALNKIKNAGKIEIKKRTPEEEKKYKESSEYKNIAKKLLGVCNPENNRHSGVTPNSKLLIKNHQAIYLSTVLFLTMISAFYLPMPARLGMIYYFLLNRNSDAVQEFLDALKQLIHSKPTTMDIFYRKINKLVEESSSH